MKFDINEATKKDISDEGMGCQENLIFQEVVGSHCCSCNHFIISWPPARHHGLLLVHPKLCSPRHRAKGQGRECPASQKRSQCREDEEAKGVVAANLCAKTSCNLMNHGMLGEGLGSGEP